MKAILYDSPATASALYFGEVEAPSLSAGQVLVQIAATALNRADILQRNGKYPAPNGHSTILGLEMAGTIVKLGEAVTNFSVGDRVCALVNGGGYAQMVSVDVGMLLRIPDNLSFIEAAAIPEVFLTAYQSLHLIAKVEPGEKVLIHAGGSGVGTAAIQLCQYAAATPIATASPAKHLTLLELGAAHCIDYTSEDFAERIKELTAGAGVNVVIDFVAAPYFEKNLKSLATDGRMVILALLGGAKTDRMNLLPILQKRLMIQGSTLRSRTQAYKNKLNAAFRDHCWKAFINGQLRPVIDSVYNWEDVAEAHQRMEQNLNLGKIVLSIDNN